ncbi:hypothetical protein SMACR_06818 [Sordaria macrospora]|uniref:WGS project CABT00000000 data, contig 2.6 n=2 Tax=Sordaria macrospora TaxID=5147 RepID=F7VSP4_SORMK|nr:uncharacterized protein SMAC_06818 [Sordaria macrospora k-hell]KAA8630370.1 hypothetical protein SMACR_06818 [Sordaria macrospora]WPJ57660.1 hypothetical protein SMAC4_06818 [Sordaria macrospora]CCC08711.1 unnamed protein product [Sordaria macrospora k-hell]
MLLTFTFALLPSTLALLPSTLALLPAASPIPPAPSTATATSTLPGNHHDAALKPRQTDWPAAFWPEDYPPDRWPGQDFGLGWGAVSRPCHAEQFYSCAGPYMRGDDGCRNAPAASNGRVTVGWSCFCEHAKEFFKCMSHAENDDPECWDDGYIGDTDGGHTTYYAGFQGCNDDRPQCCPWPISANSAQNAPPVTANIEIEPELEIEHKHGNDYPQPAHGHKTKLEHCPDDYYSISNGCCPVYVLLIRWSFSLRVPNMMNRGYYFFTSAIGGEIPCWSPLSSTASVPPLTRAAAADDPINTDGSNITGGVPLTNVEADAAPTSAINNMVFSRHYAVESAKSLSVGAYVGIAVGVSIAVSAAISFIVYLWLRKRGQKKANAKRARQQASNNDYPGIWDGPHGSDEPLFEGRELDTFKASTMDRMAAARTRNSPFDASQQARNFQPSSGFHNVGTYGHNSGMDNGFSPSFPQSVHIPPRVSSRSAAAAEYSSPPPISSTKTRISPINNDGNPWAGAVDYKGVASKEGLDSKGERIRSGKEDEALQNAGGASGSAASSSSHNGYRQQGRSHPAEIAGHTVVGRNGHESSDGLDEVEGHHEPPPEYRE